MENENAMHENAHFITTNQETAKGLLPKKTKMKEHRLSDDDRVNSARQKTKKAAGSYCNEPTKENREKLK